MKKMNIKAYLNPNPPLRGETLIDPHGRKIEMENEPFLEVELRNFPKEEYNIQILSPFTLDKKIEITSSCSSLYFVNCRFEDPSISQILIKVAGTEMVKEFTLPIVVHKVTGKVRDFDGAPSPAYIWAARETFAENEIIVKASQNGNFTLYYSEGRRLRVFVGDATYGKTSLECWIMANELKDDMEINPHIRGNFELYEFRVWHFAGVWNVFFLPAVVDSAIPPEPRKKDIRVYVNDLEGEIKSLTSHRVYFEAKDKEGYPAYIMSVVGNEISNQICPPVIIKVRVESPEKGKGEAWCIHY